MRRTRRIRPAAARSGVSIRAQLDCQPTCAPSKIRQDESAKVAPGPPGHAPSVRCDSIEGAEGRPTSREDQGQFVFQANPSASGLPRFEGGAYNCPIGVTQASSSKETRQSGEGCSRESPLGQRPGRKPRTARTPRTRPIKYLSRCWRSLSIGGGRSCQRN